MRKRNRHFIYIPVNKRGQDFVFFPASPETRFAQGGSLPVDAIAGLRYIDMPGASMVGCCARSIHLFADMPFGCRIMLVAEREGRIHRNGDIRTESMAPRKVTRTPDAREHRWPRQVRLDRDPAQCTPVQRQGSGQSVPQTHKLPQREHRILRHIGLRQTPLLKEFSQQFGVVPVGLGQLTSLPQPQLKKDSFRAGGCFASRALTVN
jgi:hypothetical protein